MLHVDLEMSVSVAIEPLIEMYPGSSTESVSDLRSGPLNWVDDHVDEEVGVGGGDKASGRPPSPGVRGPAVPLRLILESPSCPMFRR